MPPPLSNINTAKEQEATYKPLLLVDITLSDGTVLHWSTHPLNATEGGVSYGGVDYEARLADQDLQQFQTRSETGIDVVPNASIHIRDADRQILRDYVLANGFKGAEMVMTQVFHDVISGAFSSDSIPRFTGLCGPPSLEQNGRYLVIQATAKNALFRVFLPGTQISRLCPLINPVTVEQRAEASNPESKFYRCGETGSLGSAPPCSYTKPTCTQPTHFAGVTYEPRSGGRVRDYLEGYVTVKANPNESKFGDYYPEGWGIGWIKPPVMNVEPDGNAIKCEVAVAFSYLHRIVSVVVNGVDLACASDCEGNLFKVPDPLRRYNVITRGNRAGAANLDTPYNGQGDIYGNIGAILCVIPRSAGSGDSIPNVSVLVELGECRIYTDAVTYTTGPSLNPAWVLLALLMRAGWKVAEVDITSFVAVAAIAAVTVNYVDLNGNTSTRPRFQCSLLLRRRRNAGEIVRGVLNSFGGTLQQSPTTGKWVLGVEGTLAEQQPATVDGSNYNAPIASVTRAGVVTPGYAAYRFGPEQILADDDGNLKIRLYGKSLNESYNRVQFEFADQDYSYGGSSISIVDPEDVRRIGNQEFTQTIPVDGVMSYAQARAICKLILDKANRGNLSNSTDGTIWCELETSFRACRLQGGHIVLLNLPTYGFEDVMFRVQAAKPSMDYVNVKLVMSLHVDAFYLDSNGAADTPEFSGRFRDRLLRPSFPWRPAYVSPATGDPMYEASFKTFELLVSYDRAGDDQRIVEIQVTGYKPVNAFAPDLKSALVRRQGTTATSGGSLDGGGWVYYLAVCAVSADGVSPPSSLCEVVITVSGSAHTATMTITSWPSGATGWQLYASKGDPNHLKKQSEGSGTPTTLTLTAFNDGGEGLPDSECDAVIAQTKIVEHSGILAAEVEAKSTNRFTVTGIGAGGINYTGYDVSVLAIDDNVATPFLNFRVTGTSTDYIDVTPDPMSFPDIGVYSLIVVRSKPVVSGRTLTDALWQNPISNAGAGLVPADEVGREVRIITGTGRGQTAFIASATSTSITVDRDWEVAPDSTSRYIIEQPGWLGNAVETRGFSNSDETALLSLRIPVSNYTRRVLLVKVYTEDGGKNRCTEFGSPEREIYLPGAPSLSPLAGYNIVPGAVTVDLDLSTGVTQEITIDRASTTINFPTLNGGVLPDGLYFTIKLLHDGDGAGRVVIFDSAYKGVEQYPPSGVDGKFDAYPFIARIGGVEAELNGAALLGVTN